ncbi:NAD(P)/FAD-dependent oxidoreductase [Fusibacter sp. JL216-2]|uniref:NAD(P)/FAD-dependent oxidoreductase n=1 Tax=Fusibacter sp. JL216-2 TaxID=3071453 RepID=UPI003D342A59
MNDKKRILLIGAGYGGILTAKKLEKKLRKRSDVELTIIDKRPYHTMLTELHEVAANRVPEDAIRIDLKKIFAHRNIDVVMDEVKNVDFEGKKVVAEKATYEYDYLVLGTGSKPTFYGVEGAAEHTFKLWSYDDAVILKEQILKMFRLAAVEKDPQIRARMLTFVVVGCGFTGVEMIGELGEYKDELCRDFNIPKEDVKLYVADALPSLLPQYPVKLIEKAEKRLHKLGVEILTSTSITGVSADSVCLNEDSCIETNTVIWAAGVEGSDLMDTIDIDKKARNRVETNDKLQAINHEDVYVVGDNAFFIPEGHERPVPQMVENAEHSAATVAHNILAELNGKALKSYTPTFHGSMCCIGGKYGVAEVGTPSRMFAMSGFFAMFIKHFINVIYFIQVAGFNKVWTYAMHEIFHIRERRSFLGGHFAKSSPNFWLLPLRLFLGYKWLEQGIHKLPGVIADPSNIFLIPAKVSATSAASAWEGGADAAASTAADVTASASQAVEGAAQAAGEAVSQWGQALPVPEFISNIVNWSMDLMFYTPDGSFTVMAEIFQAAMVVGEVIVGLCLIAGLFTALSSIASIAMGLMIWASGMAPVEMLWYLAGGFATIGGSGSVFGMDYYVLPVLKKYWKKLKFVKRNYLYTD